MARNGPKMARNGAVMEDTLITNWIYWPMVGIFYYTKFKEV